MSADWEWTVLRYKKYERKILDSVIGGIEKKDDSLLKDEIIKLMRLYLKGKTRERVIETIASKYFIIPIDSGWKDYYQFRDEILGKVYAKLSSMDQYNREQGHGIARKLLNLLSLGEMFEEFRGIKKPKIPKNEILGEIWDNLMLNLADYGEWERKFVEMKFDYTTPFVDKNLARRINAFKPKNKREKSSHKEIKLFNDKMNEIIKKMIKLKKIKRNKKTK